MDLNDPSMMLIKAEQDIIKLKQENEQLRAFNKANADSYTIHQAKWEKEKEKLQAGQCYFENKWAETVEELEELKQFAKDFCVVKQKLKKIKEYCNEQNIKYDDTACNILKIIESEE